MCDGRRRGFGARRRGDTGGELPLERLEPCPEIFQLGLQLEAADERQHWKQQDEEERRDESDDHQPPIPAGIALLPDTERAADIDQLAEVIGVVIRHQQDRAKVGVLALAGRHPRE